MHTRFIPPDQLPPLTQPLRGDGSLLAEAMRNLEKAMRDGTILELELGPDERSSGMLGRYRVAAKRLGIRVRIRSAGFRQFRARHGEGHILKWEAGTLYISVNDMPPAPQETQHLPSNINTFDGWANGRPTRPDPDPNPAPKVLTGFVKDWHA